MSKVISLLTNVEPGRYHHISVVRAKIDYMSIDLYYHKQKEN